MSIWKDYIREVQGHLEELRAMGITDLVLPPPVEAPPPRRTGMPRPETAPPMPPPARSAPSPTLPPTPKPAASAAHPAPTASQVSGAPARAGADDSLAKIEADLAGCRRCKLSESRTNIVFGAGNPHADLMFIGEAPTVEDDAQGGPFAGKEGVLLTKIIEAMGLSRDDVYLANIVKCKPASADRIPMIDEVESCYPFLRRQIAAVAPKIIVTLGASASQALLGVTMPIARMRGNFHPHGPAIRIMPTYHPAHLLRDANLKKAVWEDMQKVMAALGLTRKSP